MTTELPFTPVSYCSTGADVVTLSRVKPIFWAIAPHDRDTKSDGTPVKHHSHLAITPAGRIDPQAIATKEYDPLHPNKPLTWRFGALNNPKSVLQKDPDWLAFWVGYALHYPPFLEKFPPRNGDEGRAEYQLTEIQTNDSELLEAAYNRMLELCVTDPAQDDPEDVELLKAIMQMVGEGCSEREIITSLKVGAHNVPLIVKTINWARECETETDPAMLQNTIDVLNARIKKLESDNRKLRTDNDTLRKYLRDHDIDPQITITLPFDPPQCPKNAPQQPVADGYTFVPCDDELPF